MLPKILIGLGILVLLFVSIVATRPAAFHIERSTTISAPPERAFALVNDFHAWPVWSPYEKLDPQMKKTFEGPAAGTGAVYSWAGTPKVGEGRMTIEKSQAPSLVSLKLEFFKPFTATNTGTFSFVQVPEGTRVTWAMDGRNGFAAKAASLFMNMDKLVGTDFERGLAAMKAAAESAPKMDATTAGK
ncbi:MAG TPA: SRPBCC family protein [Polyangiaceae bacterium]